MLGDQERVPGSFPEQARCLAVDVLGAPAAGHVGRVDPPAVEPRLEPEADHGRHPLAQALRAPVELR